MIYCFIISLLTKKILSDTTCHVHHIFRKNHPIRFHQHPPPSPHLVPGSQGRRWRRQETPAPRRRRPCRCCRSRWSRRCSAPSWTLATRDAGPGMPRAGMMSTSEDVHMTHVYMILDVYLTVYQFINLSTEKWFISEACFRTKATNLHVFFVRISSWRRVFGSAKSLGTAVGCSQCRGRWRFWPDRSHTRWCPEKTLRFFTHWDVDPTSFGEEIKEEYPHKHTLAGGFRKKYLSLVVSTTHPQYGSIGSWNHHPARRLSWKTTSARWASLAFSHARRLDSSMVKSFLGTAGGMSVLCVAKPMSYTIWGWLYVNLYLYNIYILCNIYNPTHLCNVGGSWPWVSHCKSPILFKHYILGLRLVPELKGWWAPWLMVCFVSFQNGAMKVAEWIDPKTSRRGRWKERNSIEPPFQTKQV